MAFGLNRAELNQWKRHVTKGEIAFLTHYWRDDRFPGCSTVTKVGCSDLEKLITWGKQYQLKAVWIDRHKEYPHFDLFGEIQKTILLNEDLPEHIKRFNL